MSIILALQNLTATRHGEGLLIGDGKLHATNLNFSVPKGTTSAAAMIRPPANSPASSFAAT